MLEHFYEAAMSIHIEDIEAAQFFTHLILFQASGVFHRCGAYAPDIYDRELQPGVAASLNYIPQVKKDNP